MKLSELRENPNNPSKCSEADLERLAGKLKRVPLGLTAMRIAYVTDDPGGGKMVISGNKRLRVLKRAYGEDAELPDEYFQDVTAMSESERHEFIVTANVSDGEWDVEKLLEQYERTELIDFGIEDLDDMIQDFNKQLVMDKYLNGNQQTNSLAERFVTVPSSVFITYKGEWKSRKKMWRALIDDRGESREGALSSLKLGDIKSVISTSSSSKGVSLLDPVLSEVAIRWFCPDEGRVFDCFAGDSVFGCVASMLGHQFTGIELRPEQVELNNTRVKKFNEKSNYICDDGQNVLEHIAKESQDMLFSCPPYFDLEVYSDLPNDASNQGTYDDFLKILDNAFTNAVKCLKDNRFAVIVVGDIRDKNGFYYDFVSDIKQIFRKAGMHLYNEAILVDPLSNKRLAANVHMKTRKLIKTHQNVLVFYKGNPQVIKDNFIPIDLSEAEINKILLDYEGGNEDDSTDME